MACSRIAAAWAAADAETCPPRSPGAPAPAPASAPASPASTEITSGRYRDSEKSSVASCVRSEDFFPVTARSFRTASTTCLQHARSASASISISWDASALSCAANAADSERVSLEKRSAAKALASPVSASDEGTTALEPSACAAQMSRS